jgi:hypothetical protein
LCGKHEQRERVEAGFKPPLYVERVVSGIVRPATVTKNVTNSAASLLIRDTTVSQCRHNLVVSLSSGGCGGVPTKDVSLVLRRCRTRTRLSWGCMGDDVSGTKNPESQRPE